MMKLEFIKSLLEAKKKSDGTFVGVKLSEDSKNSLYDAAKKMNVPNIIDKNEMHITVIYSRKYLPDFKSRGKIVPPIICMPSGLEIFSGKDGKGRALVVRVNCPELIARHKEIMDEHEATYDFDEYKPHITLSYNCEDFDVDSYNIIDQMDKPFIEIVEEYDTEIDLNWGKDK